jgi:hypothetical protein
VAHHGAGLGLLGARREHQLLVHSAAEAGHLHVHTYLSFTSYTSLATLLEAMKKKK